MVISKAIIGIIAGGVPVVAVTVAGSLGAFTLSSVTKQVNQMRESNSSAPATPRSDLPNYVTLEECYEISTEKATNIKLIFCTDTKFYLYGSDKSVTKVKSVKVTNSTEITITQEEGQSEKNKVFKVSESGWGSISKSEELNIERACELSQTTESITEKSLICKNNMSHPIKLPKLNK